MAAHRGGIARGSISTGRPGTAASGRSWMARRSPTCHARACRSSDSTCHFTKTGPARWTATITATTGPTGRSPNHIAGRSSTAARQIAAHFQAKGWTDTFFQGFLNNKNNFKARGWSRGSSPWLLDEPANFQDYWALRYFAQAFHEGINQAAGRQASNRPCHPPGWSSAPISLDRNGGATASTA